MGQTIHDIYATFFGSGVLVAPEYLLLCLPIAFVIYRMQGPEDGFWAWLLPRRIWTHRSHRVDLMLFVADRLLALSGFIGRIALTALVAGGVAGAIGQAEPLVPLGPWAVALGLFLLYDLAAYVAHRAYHRIGWIWPLHAVHHSAEVMTPFTAYRQHPLSTVLTALFMSVFVGALQGLFLGAVDPGMVMAQVAGINAVTMLANLAMANFHHSHIWVGFGPVLERLVISPAQHQIHHSVDPAHHDRNFGQTLALWDWMFGTLYVTSGREDLRLGLDHPDDAPLMSQRITSVLLSPLVRILRRPRAGTDRPGGSSQ